MRFFEFMIAEPEPPAICGGPMQRTDPETRNVSSNAVRPPEDDAALLSRFASKRDADALGTLATRHEGALLGLARGLMRGKDDLACEAVQSAWLKVIQYAASFKGTCAVKTWLYRIVINQCRDLAARERRLAARASAGSNGTVEAPRAAPESRGEVAHAVALLPPHQREVVLLCYHADLTHVQASEILRIPIGTLKSRLNAALTALRSSLEVRT